MPIMSYLAYPRQGRKRELLLALESIAGCEVFPADEHDLLIVVTDTHGKEQEDRLQNRLHGIPSLDFLALVSGFSDPERKHVGLIQ